MLGQLEVIWVREECSEVPTIRAAPNMVLMSLLLFWTMAEYLR